MDTERKEREVDTSPVVISYLLPDGLSCTATFLRDSNFKAAADEAIRIAENLNQETRIITSGGTAELIAINEYLNDKTSLKTSSGGTNYFEQDLNHLFDFTNLSLGKKFLLVPVGKNEKDDLEVFKSLMVRSFDSMGDNFDAASRDLKNDMYLVKDTNGMTIGGFTLYLVPQLREVQLHSLAGWSTDARVAQYKGKMPILAAGFLKALKLNYPAQISFGIGNQSFIDGGVDNLTFSSNRAAKLYKDLGFKVSSRQGIVIHPKS